MYKEIMKLDYLQSNKVFMWNAKELSEKSHNQMIAKDLEIPEDGVFIQQLKLYNNEECNFSIYRYLITVYDYDFSYHPKHYLGYLHLHTGDEPAFMHYVEI